MLILFICIFFFFNDTATTEIYTLSLHDALPISTLTESGVDLTFTNWRGIVAAPDITAEEAQRHVDLITQIHDRSEEHTSELQSRQYLVCRLLLEKKKKVVYSY